MSITGSCHCGKTACRVEGDRPARLTPCTCSFCATQGALRACGRPDAFQVTVLSADDRVYRWQARQVAHPLCGYRGCATFRDSPAARAWRSAT